MSAAIVELSKPLLIVEDNPADSELLRELLFQAFRHQTPDIIQVSSCEQALDVLKTNTPGCCLVDYRLPLMSGLDFLKNLRLDYNSDLIPVIVMTGEGDERVAVKMMRNGAQDYLVKNDITPQLLARSISNAIHSCRLQEKLRHLAHHDSLTGLLNRSLFMDRLQKSADEAERYQERFSLLFIDVDDFKNLNDHYGHQVGDVVLKTISDRIKQSCRITDSAARLGGDEFAVLLNRIEPEQASLTAEKILRRVSEPVILEDRTVQVSLSIGIAHYPESVKDIHELIKQADEAMYRAKRNGKASLGEYDEQQKLMWQRRNHLESLLPEVIPSNLLELYFQPIMDLQNNRLHSLEALSRWNPEGYQISTTELMELIDHMGLFDSFHVWLLNAALRQLSLWQAQQPHLQLNINIPANQCHSDLFGRMLKKALKAYDVQPEQVALEVTETTVLEHPGLSEKLLSSMREMGISVAIDDFGAGYSSLSNLTTLSVDTLKIDQRFIKDIDTNHANQKIIEALTLLGHGLGLQVVAEGIETEKQYQFVKSVGCDYGQGFYLGRPQRGGVSWEKFLEQQVTGAVS